MRSLRENARFHLESGDGKWVETLLDPLRPELAFYAVWAMRERHGPEAKRVETRAHALVETLPAELKTAMGRAILSVLSDAMLAWLKDSLRERRYSAGHPLVDMHSIPGMNHPGASVHRFDLAE